MARIRKQYWSRWLPVMAAVVVAIGLSRHAMSVPPPPTDSNQKPVAPATGNATSETGDVPVYQFQWIMGGRGVDYLLAADADGALVKLLMSAENHDTIYKAFGPPMLDRPRIFFEAEITNVAGHDVVQSVKPYQVLPCESSPTGYAFEGTTQKVIGTQSTTAMVLKKLGRTTTALVPSARSNAGAPVPDPTLLAAVQSLKEGDGVDVRFAKSGTAGAKSPAMLASIEPYLDPIEGEYQGAGEVDDAGGKLKGVKIKVGEDVKILPWATVDALGKPLAHPALTPPKYKPGFPLRVLMRHVGDRDEVRDVEYIGSMSVQNDSGARFTVWDAELDIGENFGRMNVNLVFLNEQDDATRFINGIYRTTLTPAAHPELTAAQLNRLKQVESATRGQPNTTAAQNEQLKALYAVYIKASTFAQRWDAQQQMYLAVDLLTEDHRAQRAKAAAAGEQGLPPEVVKSLISLGTMGGFGPAHGQTPTQTPAGSSLLGTSDAPQAPPAAKP